MTTDRLSSANLALNPYLRSCPPIAATALLSNKNHSNESVSRQAQKAASLAILCCKQFWEIKICRLKRVEKESSKAHPFWFSKNSLALLTQGRLGSRLSNFAGPQLWEAVAFSILCIGYEAVDTEVLPKDCCQPRLRPDRLAFRHNPYTK